MRMGLESTWPLCPKTLAWYSVFIAVHAVGTGIPLFRVRETAKAGKACAALDFVFCKGSVR